MNNENHIEEVVHRALRGDDQAKSELYIQFCKPMYNICLRITGNNKDAEDVLHDVFISAFNSLHQLKEPQRFAGWLKKITINQCIAFSKKHINWKDITEENELILETPEESWFLKFTLADIGDAAKKLPEGCRQVFALYAIEDRSHKEIAGLLEISESTSKSQYHRAKFLIKKYLETNKNHG